MKRIALAGMLALTACMPVHAEVPPPCTTFSCENGKNHPGGTEAVLGLILVNAIVQWVINQRKRTTPGIAPAPTRRHTIAPTLDGGALVVRWTWGW